MMMIMSPQVMPADVVPGNMFIFGLGYTAQALAKQLRKSGWQMRGTCRTPEKQRFLKDNFGLEAFIYDSDHPLKNGGLEAMHQATHLLSCIPPDSSLNTDPVLDQHKADIISAPHICWIGYISSTGVYGDHQGGWVDENTMPNPVDLKGIARLRAENQWLQLGSPNTSVQIFRPGGIYGPGRSILDAVRKKDAPLSSRQLARDDRRFISRVHVEDICQGLIASIRSPRNGGVYNLVDDDPASRSEVVAFAKQLVGDDETSMTESPPMVTRSSAEKRVVNRRMKNELGVQLLYPSYVQGLTAIESLS